MSIMCRPTFYKHKPSPASRMHDQHGGAARLAGRRRLPSARITTGAGQSAAPKATRSPSQGPDLPGLSHDFNRAYRDWS